MDQKTEKRSFVVPPHQHRNHQQQHSSRNALVLKVNKTPKLLIQLNDCVIFIGCFVIVIVIAINSYYCTVLHRMCWVSRCCVRTCLQLSWTEWAADRAKSVSLFNFYGAFDCWRWKCFAKGISTHGEQQNKMNLNTKTERICWITQYNDCHSHRRWLDLKTGKIITQNGNVVAV